MNLMKHRKWFYGLSSFLVLASLLAIVLWGLLPSIDFVGGSKIEFRGTDDVEAAREFAEENELEGPVVQRIGEDGLSIRFAEISEEKHREISGRVEEFFGEGVEEVGFETVGPTISREATRNAFILVSLASLVIIFYIAYSFRRVPKPVTSWEFGAAAILALFHDTVIVVGIFAFLGRFFNVEVDPLFITGVLTVIGFSVHDTVVLFDRVRENLIKKGPSDLAGTVNTSVLEMLPRTITTSFLVWSILLILFLFGGITIRYFVLTLLIGVIAGVYSSPLVAAPFLISWQNLKKKGLPFGVFGKSGKKTG